MSMVVYQQSVAEVVAFCKVSTNVKKHDFKHTVYIVIGYRLVLQNVVECRRVSVTHCDET